MRRALATLLFLPVACSVGPAPATFAPAQGPQGVMTELRLTSARRLRGELLAVDDTTIMLLRDSRVTVVWLSVIWEGRLAQAGAFIERGRMQQRNRERARLLSRFPQGLAPALLQRLLTAHGQDDPDVVRPASFPR